MPALPVATAVCDFCFKFGRFSWKERYFNQSTGSSLQSALEDAKVLARARIPMLGSDGTVEGSPRLDRIVVSRTDRYKDAIVTTEFKGATPDLAGIWAIDGALNPEWSMVYKMSSGAQYWSTRFLSGIPVKLLASASPETDPRFTGQFQKFRAALQASWGFLAINRTDGLSVDHPIIHMAKVDASHIQIWSETLPTAGVDVEIRQGRFLKGSPPVRGFYHVSSLAPTSFIVEADMEQDLHYMSSAFWRIPSGAIVPVTTSTTPTELGSRKRGFTLHAERGRKRSSPHLVF